MKNTVTRFLALFITMFLGAACVACALPEKKEPDESVNFDVESWLGPGAKEETAGTEEIIGTEIAARAGTEGIVQGVDVYEKRKEELERLHTVYWKLPVTASESGYEVVLKDLVPGESLQVVIKEGEKELLLGTYQKDKDYKEPSEYFAETFEKLFGYNGFCLSIPNGVGYSSTYYAVENGEILLLAESWGNFYDKENVDFQVDIDGDGEKELICNVTWLADGAQRTRIYRYENGRVYCGNGEDMLDEAYDNFGVGSLSSRYDPEKNVISISYWKEDKNDFVTKEYPPDWSKLAANAEVFFDGTGIEKSGKTQARPQMQEAEE